LGASSEVLVESVALDPEYEPEFVRKSLHFNENTESRRILAKKNFVINELVPGRDSEDKN
jgi:hypothetical protein